MYSNLYDEVKRAMEEDRELPKLSTYRNINSGISYEPSKKSKETEEFLDILRKLIQEEVGNAFEKFKPSSRFPDLNEIPASCRGCSNWPGPCWCINCVPKIT